MQVNGCGDTAWPYHLADEITQALVPAGETRRLEAGERLFSFGETAQGVYLIIKGTARATFSAAENELATRTAGAGAILGLPAALCSNRYQFDVEAVETLETVFLTTESVNEILRRQPELCMQVMNMMCDELSGLQQTRAHMSNCNKVSCALHPQCSRLTNLQ